MFSTDAVFFGTFSILISGCGIHAYKRLIANNTQDVFSLLIIGTMSDAATFALFSPDAPSEAQTSHFYWDP